MKKLIVLFIILALIFVAAYFMFPFVKEDIPILPEKKSKEQTKPEQQGKEGIVSKTPEKESFKPIHVSSAKGLELWYNGYRKGIVNSFPSYVITILRIFLFTTLSITINP